MANIPVSQFIHPINEQRTKDNIMNNHLMQRLEAQARNVRSMFDIKHAARFLCKQGVGIDVALRLLGVRKTVRF